MNANDLRRLCARAGVTADEMHDHPEHGLMLSASGVRKLAAIAPDRERAKDALDQVAVAVRNTFRVVPGAA